MDKAYNHKNYEEKIYKLWEDSGAFKESKAREKYTILMPPPNANASLHAGHAMYTVDDILVRWKRMQGYSSLWIPGRDHAGFETQFVYEKNLAKVGKSRMDFDRETLYQNVFKFVEENSNLIFNQMKRLGFSADWDRSVFTLDPHVIDTVYKTFTKMEKEGYVYRGDYIVNFCVHDGTSLAELEVKHVERTDPLYFVKYQLVGGNKHISVATVRPETIFIDTHLAVNPKDNKNNSLIGKKVLNPLTDKEMEIIGDDFVDPDFGTGIVKLTPAHDAADYTVAKKHGLPIISAINFRGKIVELPNELGLHNLKVKVAREKVVEILQNKNLIDHIDKNYLHNVSTCYKCGRDLEPLVTPNWFIRVDKLKAKVKDVVEKEEVKFHPKRFKTHMLNWLEIMHDWPISRQIVWGIKIPVWYKINRNHDNITVRWIDKDENQHSGSLIEELNKGIKLEEIKEGLQEVVSLVEREKNYIVSIKEPKDGEYIQETDTFDTWFSSGQWPLVTLKDNEFETRFPTDTMGTLSDILKFWISRMILFSLYLQDEIPFKDVYLWSMVADAKGIKMSKSKGNVINPLDLVEKYGADALRMSLMYGTPAGSKVILSDDKVRSMRNFANKVWNIARFTKEFSLIGHHLSGTAQEDENTDKWIMDELNKTKINVTKSLDSFKLNDAAEEIYEFIWHKLADVYIEKIKPRKTQALPVLRDVLLDSIKLLHPFMPFVTESIYQELYSKSKDDLLITSSWPKA